MFLSRPAPFYRCETPPKAVPGVGLMFTAVAALLLGTAVYVLDRNWASAMFLKPFVDYQWPRSEVFGALGGFLPALLHAYAISVLIVVALWPWPRTRVWACLLWFVIASTLEWLQSDAGNAWLIGGESLARGDVPLLAYFKSYAFQGQFDTLDLLATGAGCLGAMVLTIAVERYRQRTEV